MATISLNPEFETLLNGLGDTRLPNFALDHGDLLRNFRLDDDELVGDVTLSSTGLTAQFASLDPDDSGIYTFRISGNGIQPSSTLQGLQQAIEFGTANGTINRVSIDYGNLRIAQVDIASENLTFSSGDQRLELTGGFPVTLSQLINLVDILDGEAEGSLEAYGFTGFTLRDNGEVLASLEIGETVTLNLDGFVLSMTGADISVAELFDFINPGRAQIVPEITLFDASGNIVTGAVFGFSDDDPNLTRIAYENLPEGTYFAQVTASNQQIANFQTQTGLYELYSSWWGNISGTNQWTFENMGDAPADSSTPYVLNSGARFFGAVDFEGDADWISLDFPNWFGTTYTQTNSDTGEVFTFNNALVLQAFGTGQTAPPLRDLQGISFESLTITDPNGTVILSATDVENFRNFIDELDAILGSFFVPSLGDLSLAFATGDPHLLTHDGLGYDFHAAGEYVLMRATNDDTFELQSRMSPAGENVTANVAAALQLGDDTIMIAPGATQLRINGDARAMADGDVIQLDTGVITREGNSYKIYVIAQDESQSLVQVDIVGSRVDIGVGLSSYWQDSVEGLLGNFNGTTGDDLVFDGGEKSLQIPLQFGDDAEAGTYGVYGEFRDYWRVRDDSTLFTYAEGEGPDSFYLADYPTQMTTLDDFSTEAQAEAGALAEAAGLIPGSFAYNNAVLDLLVTQDNSYLDSAVQSEQFTQNVTSPEAPPPAIEVPLVAGGGLGGLLSLSGSVSDLAGNALSDATITFRPDGKSVNLTRMTRDSDSFEFNLSQNSEGRLDASRDWQAGDPSITALDALNVLRIAVGVSPSFGEVTAQHLIAADVNADGRVTALDALEVLRAAVGVSSANAPRWVFFDAETDWDALELSRTNTHVETGINIASLTENTGGVDMVGILLGNMEIV